MGITTICILEQSGTVPNRAARNRARAAAELGIGYARLNWNQDLDGADNLATMTGFGLTWCEGRSVLAEWGLSKKYDYLVFMDDDVVLLPRWAGGVAHVAGILLTPLIRRLLRIRKLRTGSIANFFCSLWLTRHALMTLRDTILKSQMLSGNIFAPTDWAFRSFPSSAKIWPPVDFFPIGFHDLQTQIFSAEVARHSFPCPIKGSGASMWWAQWLGATAWPARQLCISNVFAFNTRSDPHQDHTNEGFVEGKLLLELMRGFVRETSAWDAVFHPKNGYKSRLAFNLDAWRSARDGSFAKIWPGPNPNIGGAFERLLKSDQLKRIQEATRLDLSSKWRFVPDSPGLRSEKKNK